jgi:hypothetical protein
MNVTLEEVQATCMLEHLAEQMGENDSDASFGQYQLYKTIVEALRHGVEQLLDENESERAARGGP